MNETIANRLDRTQYTLKDALDEIALAEAILDGSGATEGLTLWGRIAALRQRIAELEGERDALRGLAAFAQHHPNCPSQWARSCPCGYTDARNAVAALERR